MVENRGRSAGSKSNLVSRLNSGTRKIWFEEQIRQCEKDIIRFACHITGNMEKAKDLIQEAFLRAYKYRYSYNDKYPFRNWLYAILLNIHRHNCKKKSFLRPLFLGKIPMMKSRMLGILLKARKKVPKRKL